MSSQSHRQRCLRPDRVSPGGEKVMFFLSIMINFLELIIN
jgi:hypothetical protein